MRPVPRSLAPALLATALIIPSGAVAATPAPGAPGAKATWTRADKQGFGTAVDARSKVWFTLSRGELTEVYHPRLDSPSLRDLELVVTDGRSFVERESSVTRQRVEQLPGRGLTYRQVNTARSGRYRITKTYVTDPARPVVLVDVRFESLTGRPYRVYLLSDPALGNDGDDDRGRTVGRTLTAREADLALALRTSPALAGGSSGYLGRSDGWRDLKANRRLTRSLTADRRGNVVQVGRTTLTGRPGGRHLRIALGFAAGEAGARRRAGAALPPGSAPRRATTRPAGSGTWRRCGLRRPPLRRCARPTTRR